MKFTMNCPRCSTIMAPHMDQQTLKVYCSNAQCAEEITNITIFAKNQMKMEKQFRQKEKKPFAVKCESCKAEDRPVLIDGKIICVACLKELTNLSPTFVMMLKANLSKAGQDI
jgi:hypothetical protein